jgi:hypothetical protein
MAVKIDYEVLRKALEHGTKDIFAPEDFDAWAENNGVDREGLRQMGMEIATVALADMRDQERTLAEALASTFLSGFIGAFGLLRPAVADETFEFIAQGKKVSVRIANVEHVDE